jgi:hypothetical protein
VANDCDDGSKELLAVCPAHGGVKPIAQTVTSNQNSTSSVMSASRHDIRKAHALVERNYLETVNAMQEVKPQEPAFPLTLPTLEAEELKRVYAAANSILEYGSGGSTVFAAGSGKPCISVESDKAWSARLEQHLTEAFGPDCLVKLLHIDIGETKAWGYPVNNARADNFWAYPLQVWDDPLASEADTVLIDGRFRKACFAATLLRLARPATILFDDYLDRPFYHEVETLLKPSRTIGRMAVFDAQPNMIGAEHFARTIPWFSEVR